MMKDFLNEFDWIKEIFDFNGDGLLDDEEAFIAFDSLGVRGTLISPTKDPVLYELASAGVDITAFEFMDDEEKREEIEDAGLDPDDYDLD